MKLFLKKPFLYVVLFAVVLMVVCGMSSLSKDKPKLLLKSKITYISNDSIISINRSNYIYDSKNRVIEIRYLKNDKPDGYSMFFYDKQLSHYIMYDTDSLKTGITKFEFKDNNLIKRTTFNSDESIIKKHTNYTYNEKDRVIKIETTKPQNETSSTLSTVFYEYLENNTVKKINKYSNDFYLIKYDSKKTPYFDIPFFTFSLMNSDIVNDFNNIVSYTKSTNNKPVFLYSNTYDEDDFLKKQSISIKNNNYIKEYTYNK